jgi:hypothetical protein
VKKDKMWTICLAAFIIAVIVKYIREDKSYILFSRAVTMANSITDKSPRYATVENRFLVVEYKFGTRIYRLIIPKKSPMTWVKVGAMKAGSDKFVNRTSKIEYFAGPFKNFHELPVKPRHISQKYVKLSFVFANGVKIHVEGEQPIYETLTRKLNEMKDIRIKE